MSKFHVNKEGVPASCRAKKDKCPLGGEETHFDNIEDAQKYADKELEKEFGLIPVSVLKVSGDKYETSNGLEYSVSKENNFNGYDKTVADTHLNNYGEIYLDSYGKPIDNEYELETIENEHKKRDL